MNLNNRLNDLKDKITDEADFDNFEKYILPHSKLIFNSAYRLSGNEEDAQDLLQETFFYALKNFSQLNDRNKCKYWLFSILKNLFLKEIQKSKKRVDLEFELFLNRLHNINHLEEDYLKEETRLNIRELLDNLEERLRRPLVLYYFERLSYKQIAEVLELPIGTVMSRISRGKVYLKKNMIRSEAFRAEIEDWLEDEDLP